MGVCAWLISMVLRQGSEEDVAMRWLQTVWSGVVEV